MKYLNINLNKVKVTEIKLIIEALNQGQIIVYPTDTIYGLGCRADKPAAIARIKAIKGLAADKPLLVLMSSLKQLRYYCHLDFRQTLNLKKRRLSRRPTSFILTKRGNLPLILTGNSDGLGFRLPKSKFLRKILRALSSPLVSTSLNLSGQKILTSPANLPAALQADLIIDGGLLKNKPSRIIDLRRERPKVLRK